MDIFFIFILLAVVLFVLSYIHKRRFGLLGLALAAGSLLSGIWGYNAGLIAGGLGAPSGAVTTAIVLSVIVLLPAVILLFHGPTYHNLFGRVIGAGLFTILALAFLIEPLSHALMPQGAGADAYNWLVDNRNYVIGFGLIAAVADLFLTKPAHLSDKRHKH